VAAAHPGIGDGWVPAEVVTVKFEVLVPELANIFVVHRVLPHHEVEVFLSNVLLASFTSSVLWVSLLLVVVHREDTGILEQLDLSVAHVLFSHEVKKVGRLLESNLELVSVGNLVLGNSFDDLNLGIDLDEEDEEVDVFGRLQLEERRGRLQLLVQLLLGNHEQIEFLVKEVLHHRLTFGYVSHYEVDLLHVVGVRYHQK